MTIAGKRGRPRKWRSDADQARAYRARRRGESEPPQLAQITDETDELAVARLQLRRVSELVRQLRRSAESLRSKLRRARQDLEAERRRSERVLEVNRGTSVAMPHFDTGRRSGLTRARRELRRAGW